LVSRRALPSAIHEKEIEAECAHQGVTGLETGFSLGWPHRKLKMLWPGFELPQSFSTIRF
jgi:hypothetical protein